MTRLSTLVGKHSEVGTDFLTAPERFPSRERLFVCSGFFTSRFDRYSISLRRKCGSLVADSAIGRDPIKPSYCIWYHKYRVLGLLAGCADHSVCAQTLWLRGAMKSDWQLHIADSSEDSETSQVGIKTQQCATVNDALTHLQALQLPSVINPLSPLTGDLSPALNEPWPSTEQRAAILQLDPASYLPFIYLDSPALFCPRWQFHLNKVALLWPNGHLFIWLLKSQGHCAVNFPLAGSKKCRAGTVTVKNRHGHRLTWKKRVKCVFLF